MSTNEKSKYWATLFYIDNYDIVTINNALINLHVKCCLSPLHNFDRKEDYIFEFKKPHYHCLFIFQRAVGYPTMDYIMQKLRYYKTDPVGLECVIDGVAYSRYLCHLDNLEKYQYNVDDILYYGGVKESILCLYKLSPEDKSMIKLDICDDIENNIITSINDLKSFYSGDRLKQAFVVNNASCFEKFCRDMYWKVKNSS